MTINFDSLRCWQFYGRNVLLVCVFGFVFEINLNRTSRDNFLFLLDSLHLLIFVSNNANTRVVMVILQEFLQKIIKDSVLYAENGRRKRVTGEDVDAALKNNGIKVYGLEGACSQSNVDSMCLNSSISITKPTPTQCDFYTQFVIFYKNKDRFSALMPKDIISLKCKGSNLYYREKYLPIRGRSGRRKEARHLP